MNQIKFSLTGILLIQKRYGSKSYGMNKHLIKTELKLIKH